MIASIRHVTARSGSLCNGATKPQAKMSTCYPGEPGHDLGS